MIVVRIHAAVFLFAVLVAGVRAATQSLTFELGDNEHACFYQLFRGSESQTFVYEVLRGGQNDIDATVESPNGKILYKEKKQTRGTFLFESSFGIYSFCFGNEFSTFSHKRVYFSLRPTADAADDDAADMAVGRGRPHANTQAESSIDGAHENLVGVIREQTAYRLNEMRGRAVAEDANARVHWWSLSQACVVVVAGCGQILILKFFFSESRARVGIFQQWFIAS